MASIDQELKHEFKSNKKRLIANLFFTSSWIRNLHLDFLKPYGISSTQFNILRILRGAGDWIAMGSVKERMVEKAPNATRLVDKMLEKGLVERKRSESDRRVVYVRISESGKALLKEIDDDKDGFQVEEIVNLSEEEAGIVSSLLEKMRS